MKPVQGPLQSLYTTNLVSHGQIISSLEARFIVETLAKVLDNTRIGVRPESSPNLNTKLGMVKLRHAIFYSGKRYSQGSGQYKDWGSSRVLPKSQKCHTKLGLVKLRYARL